MGWGLGGWVAGWLGSWVAGKGLFISSPRSFVAYARCAVDRAATNQFSVTQHMKYIRFDRGQHGLPGVFFMYDISPMMIRVYEERRSFMHFLTGVCAIVGGVFTVAGMVDSTLYHGLKSIRRKQELGKLG